MPLTFNGKIDRRALPDPAGNGLDTGREYVGPRTPVEEALAGIWCDVLKLEQAGIHDSFFALGGHSLLATQVMSRIREVFALELPVYLVFEKPTIAELASEIQGQQSPGARLIIARERAAELPLSYAQERLWFLDQLVPNNPFYNMPTVFRASGPLDVVALGQALSEIARRHEALRTIFGRGDRGPLQIIKGTYDVPLPVVDCSGLPDEQRERLSQDLVNQEAMKAFNLNIGPLLRVRVIRLTAQDHLIVVVIHHIVSDAWSMAVFTGELRELYNNYRLGDASELPELPIQYVDFALWQRDWLRGDELERQMNYWRERLGNLPSLSLPCDRLRPTVSSFRGAVQRMILSEELSQGLKKLCRNQGVTLFMALVATFKVLLMRYSNQEDLAIGAPIANRNRSEIEGLVGFFVNTLVMRTDLSGWPGFNDLLARVKESALQTYAHQDLPFEKLVEELHPQRDLSRNPLFQVMFALQNAPDSGIDFGDVALRRQLPTKVTT